MAYYYNEDYQSYDYQEKMKSLVMEKVALGLSIAAGISLLALLIPGILVLYPIAFITEIVAIIAYFFVRNESRLEKFYYMFVASSGLILGGLMTIVASDVGFASVAYALAITASIVIGMYYYTYRNQPNVARLGRILFPIAIAYIALIVVSIFLFPQFLGSLLFSVLGAALFSLYLFYDLGRLMQGQYSSPVRMAWNIYWDIYLVFKYILMIIWQLNSNR